MERGQIIALATEVIPPENTPEKMRGESLIAHPRWKYIGPKDSIRFEWQIGRWGWAGFAGDTARKYITLSQPASIELKEFTASLPAISLSPLSPGYYDCEILFKDKFSDLRVIVQNCVRIVEEAPPQYTLTITLSPVGGGYVTLSPETPGYIYPSGTTVTLTANPYPGYEFDRWGGAVSGTSPTVSVTMSSDKRVVANFREVAVGYTLAVYQFPEEGYVEKTPDKPYYSTGEVVRLTAYPPYGHTFGYWLINGSMKSYNPIDVTMTKNVIAEAYYIPM